MDRRTIWYGSSRFVVQGLSSRRALRFEMDGYSPDMSAKPNSAAAPKVAPTPSKRRDLSRGLPGTDRKRGERRREFAEEHRETLRRLGK